MNLSPTITNIKEKLVPRATQFLLFILIIFIPFSIRYVFGSTWNFHTGAYSDFTSLSIYILDFAVVSLIAFVGLFHMKQRLSKFWLISTIGLILWMIMELFIQSKDLLPLQVYFTIRFGVLLLLCAAVSQIKVSREKIAWLFTILGAVQGLIATIQFYIQKSLGLYILGESHLSPDILGVAKIVAHGTKLIRGYGTFPHPNLLAAFLVSTTILNLYLITITSQKSRDIWLYVLLLANIFGLFVSLSRGGLLALSIGTISVIAIMAIQREFKIVKKLIFPLLISIGISIAILAPYLTTRTTIQDNATKERLFYSEIGENMILNNPIIGVGPGLSVLHMKQYTPEQLDTWEIQPIHNYWLISRAELGFGTIFLIILIFLPIFNLFKPKMDIWQISLFSIGLSFQGLFILDHYFYTIWPTQVLLWLFLGLMIGSVSHGTNTTKVVNS